MASLSDQSTTAHQTLCLNRRSSPTAPSRSSSPGSYLQQPPVLLSCFRETFGCPGRQVRPFHLLLLLIYYSITMCALSMELASFLCRQLKCLTLCLDKFYSAPHSFLILVASWIHLRIQTHILPVVNYFVAVRSLSLHD